MPTNYICTHLVYIKHQRILERKSLKIPCARYIFLQHDLGYRGLPFPPSAKGSGIALDGIAERLAATVRWSESLQDLHGSTADRFARSKATEWVFGATARLLMRVDRKNG